MEVFNNREIASAIWLSILFLFSIAKNEIRKSLYSLLKVLFGKKLCLVWASLVIYVLGVVFFLYKLRFWDFSLLKDTVIWLVFSAIVTVMNSTSFNPKEGTVKRYITDNMKVAVIMEFIVNSYTFSLFWELIFFPIMALIIATETYVQNKDKYKQVSKFLNGLLAIIGFYVLFYCAFSIINDYKNFGTLDTLKEFLLVPLLTLMFIPYIYIFVLISNYEQIFVRLNVGIIKEKEIKRYAKRKFFFYCLLSIKRQVKILRLNAFKFTRVRTLEDVDEIVREWRLNDKNIKFNVSNSF